MPGTCMSAADVAKNCAAQTNSAEYQMLSSKMCWDAVTHCALLAGVIEQDKAAALSGAGHDRLVNASHSAINNASDMGKVPKGHVIGFFPQWNHDPRDDFNRKRHGGGE